MKNPKSAKVKIATKNTSNVPIEVTNAGCCGGQTGHAHDDPHFHGHAVGLPAPAGAGTIDPVCGMTVDPETAKHQADYEGRTNHFCSGGCKNKFLSNAAKYLALPNASANRASGSWFLSHLWHGTGTQDSYC